MWPWRKKPPVTAVHPTQRDVLAGWKAQAKEGAPFQSAIALGLAREKATFPYAITVAGQDGIADWIAPNTQIAGNVLVTWTSVADGSGIPDPAGMNVYEQFVPTMRRLSRWIIPVSDTVWLIGTVEDIATVHREVGGVLGPMSRSLTVVDLFSRRAIGWDARRGIMTEIEPARPEED